MAWFPNIYKTFKMLSKYSNRTHSSSIITQMLPLAISSTGKITIQYPRPKSLKYWIISLGHFMGFLFRIWICRRRSESSHTMWWKSHTSQNNKAGIILRFLWNILTMFRCCFNIVGSDKQSCVSKLIGGTVSWKWSRKCILRKRPKYRRNWKNRIISIWIKNTRIRGKV